MNRPKVSLLAGTSIVTVAMAIWMGQWRAWQKAPPAHLVAALSPTPIDSHRVMVGFDNCGNHDPGGAYFVEPDGSVRYIPDSELRRRGSIGMGTAIDPPKPQRLA